MYAAFRADGRSALKEAVGLQDVLLKRQLDFQDVPLKRQL